MSNTVEEKPLPFREQVEKNRAHFIVTWNASTSVQQVADALGLAYSTVAIRASKYRRQGWPVKLMTDRQADPTASRHFSLRLSEADYTQLFEGHAEENDRVVEIIRKGLFYEAFEKSHEAPAGAPVGVEEARPEARPDPTHAAGAPALPAAPDGQPSAQASSDALEGPSSAPGEAAVSGPNPEDVARLAAMRLDDRVDEATYQAEKAKIFGDNLKSLF